ncbi:unnamed protein product, partial [Cyprideis torosa]
MSTGISTELRKQTRDTTKLRVFKIIVIGDSSVGKTCLTFRFCSGRFPEKTEATIGVDFRERITEVDGEKIKSLPHWVEECNKHHLTYEIPRLLIGNKCDIKEHIAVSTTRAQRFADLHNM